MNDDPKKASDTLNNSPLRKALEEMEDSPMARAKKALEATRPLYESFAPIARTYPTFQPPRLPTHKEVNQYQSAESLVLRLANTIKQWRAQLPEDQQPAIIALLHGGIQINVHLLAAESFHGIRIEGSLQGNPCLIVAHQSTVQMLCFVEPAEEPRRPIGFVIGGTEQQI